jgi:hypothetical protein
LFNPTKRLTILCLLCCLVLLAGCQNPFDKDDDDDGGNNNPTTITFVYVNETGLRLRVYLDGVLLNFLEIGQTQSFPNNPAGSHSLTADNFSAGNWGPVTVTLSGGETYTWTLR